MNPDRVQPRLKTGKEFKCDKASEVKSLEAAGLGEGATWFLNRQLKCNPGCKPNSLQLRSYCDGSCVLSTL